MGCSIIVFEYFRHSWSSCKFSYEKDKVSKNYNEKEKQAGAEQCQAQAKLHKLIVTTKYTNVFSWSKAIWDSFKLSHLIGLSLANLRINQYLKKQHWVSFYILIKSNFIRGYNQNQ